MLARPARASPGSVTWRPGRVGRTPLGRPVVPEEYSMVEPLGWSADRSGRAGGGGVSCPPWGGPVVPEEYSMVEPLGWSANGSAGAAAIVSSYLPCPLTGP